MQKMSVAEEIRQRLEQSFAPEVLEISDDSEAHRGHAGYREGGESHFSVRIRSKAFEGQSRIARHRAVHEALGKDILSRIHALSIQVELTGSAS